MITSEVGQNSDIIKVAQELYKKVGAPEKKLFSDILYYATNHYAYCSPDCIILAEVVDSGWFVFLAVSKTGLKKFFDIAPFELPYVGWSREARGKDKINWHNWQKVKNLCSLQTK